MLPCDLPRYRRIQNQPTWSPLKTAEDQVSKVFAAEQEGMAGTAGLGTLKLPRKLGLAP